MNRLAKILLILMLLLVGACITSSPASAQWLYDGYYGGYYDYGYGYDYYDYSYDYYDYGYGWGYPYSYGWYGWGW